MKYESNGFCYENTYLKIPNYDPPEGMTKILGFDAIQNRNAVPCWSYFFERERPARVIELGAFTGGFTCVLGILAKNYKATCHTYDLSFQGFPYKAWFEFLGIDAVTDDLFEPTQFDRIHQLIASPGKTFLLCDNGEKDMEWELFAPFLKVGDIIGAHDYMVSYETWLCAEFSKERSDKTSQRCGLTQVVEPDFSKAAWYVCRKEI